MAQDSEYSDSDGSQGSESPVLVGRSTSVLSSLSLRFSPFQRSPVAYFNKSFQAGSIKGAVATLVVSIVGAGTLSVPFAIQQSGLVLGGIFFFIGALLASFTLNLLVLSSEITGEKSYQRIAARLYGKNAETVITLGLVCNLYGTTVSYLVAAGHTFSFVIRHVLFNSAEEDDVAWWARGKYLTLIVTIFVIFPLSLLRSMTALRHSSLMGVCCTVYLALIVALKYVDFCTANEQVSISTPTYHEEHSVTCFWDLDESNSSSPNSHTPEMFKVKSLGELLTTIPIVVYAFTCHPSLLPILVEVKRPSVSRMTRVVQQSTAISLLIYLFVGSFVYLTFTDQLNYSKGNFLLNDYHNDSGVLLGAFGMAVSITFAVPLFVTAFRNVAAPVLMYRLDYAAYARFISHSSKRITLREELEELEDAPFIQSTRVKARIGWGWHLGLGVGLLVFAVLPAVLVADVSTVFTVMGATSNPLLCFVFPAMFVVKFQGLWMTKLIAVTVAIVVPVVCLSSLYLQFNK